MHPKKNKRKAEQIHHHTTTTTLLVRKEEGVCAGRLVLQRPTSKQLIVGVVCAVDLDLASGDRSVTFESVCARADVHVCGGCISSEPVV